MIDIVIPVHATREHPTEKCFEYCLDTLADTTNVDYRLIIVDDFSDVHGQMIISYLAQQHRACKDAIYHRTPKQKWFTRAVNIGLSYVQTERALCLNSDVILTPGWLEELYAVWDNAAFVTGRKVGLVGSVMSPHDPRRWIETRKPDYVTGHAWLLSMEAMHAVANSRGTPGKFLDETKIECIHIKSDVYLCYDMNRLGYGTFIATKSNVGHEGGKSWGHNLAKVFSLKLKDVD